MQNQQPTAFEFSETYLTSLWDSIHNSVFDSFMFDSDRVRHLVAQQEADCPSVVPRSVWDWSAQFHDVDIGLFYNPLYAVTSRVGSARQRRGIPPTSVLAPAEAPVRWSAPHERPRRNSVSGSMTLPRSEYGAAEPVAGSDTLGRSWGSRFGLSAIVEHGQSVRLRSTTDGGASGYSRWKNKFRSGFFPSHGRSFSPRAYEVASIEEGLEVPTFGEVFHPPIQM